MKLTLSWPSAHKGGTSKDNNNHEVDCDLIFNATTPSTILHSKLKIMRMCLFITELLTFTLFDDHLAWKADLNVKYLLNYSAVNISDELCSGGRG